MKFSSLSSILFSFCLLGLSSQETLAESNGQRIQLENNSGKQVSYGLIEYSLQPTEKETSPIFIAYINQLIARALNFELTQTFDNLEVLATEHGFFIQYRLIAVIPRSPRLLTKRMRWLASFLTTLMHGSNLSIKNCHLLRSRLIKKGSMSLH